MTATPTSAVPSRPPAPDRRPRRGPLGRALLVLVLLAVAAGAAFLVVKATEPPTSNRGDGLHIPALDVLPGTALAQARPLPADPDVAAWAERAAKVTDIPVRTLVAYVNADLVTRQRDPDCKITWATLAGVGRVESHHGHFAGARVGDDGKLTKPIIGVPLNGSKGVRAIRDTDGGKLDGDTQWDRAVGSMQFLPSTWTRWAAHPDGGAPDPQDVDDAALTAARYLCASGGDLSTGDGWWKAVLTYNNSVAYGRDVYSGADAYARKVAELG
ncbi:murein transglycosylase [Actinokineospora sp. HUAS TT18]|uniref:murein transglycosylase n=1 Tax=Actinokineospora sp. HUAS TT18 TaxID=3447451 RepID=UPI003F51E77F